MKCSLRFEKLLAERRALAAYKDMNDVEILQGLLEKYNGFKANAALKRWQISQDQFSAMLGVIVGMTREARALIRSHLDWNKWEESGFLADFALFFLCAEALARLLEI